MHGTDILKIILLAVLINLAVAGDYYISFKYYVKNYRLVYSKFNCSKALTNSKAPKKLLFSFKCRGDISECCFKYKDKIVDLLLKKVVFISSNDHIEKTKLTTTQKLTFLPQRFDIIIKNGSIYFYIKGE